MTDPSMTEEHLALEIDENHRKLMNSYKIKPDDLPGLQKQMIWRSKNLGMKELDITCGVYARRFVGHLSREECLKYEKEILEMESPDLYKLVLGIKDEKELGKYIDDDHYV